MPYITPETKPETDQCFRLLVPDDPYWLAALYGALDELGKEYNHESVTGLSAGAVALVWRQIMTDAIEKGCPSMIGVVMASTLAVLPDHLLSCNGREYNASEYPELYAVIHESFKTPNNKFKVPDLSRKFIRGGFNSSGMNEAGGDDEVTLTIPQLPVVTVVQNAHGHQAIAHTHTQAGHQHLYQTPSINLDVEGPGVPDPFGAGLPMLPAGTDWRAPEIFPAGGDVNVTTATNQAFGGGEAHNNIPEYLTLQYVIVARD